MEGCTILCKVSLMSLVLCKINLLTLPVIRVMCLETKRPMERAKFTGQNEAITRSLHAPALTNRVVSRELALLNGASFIVGDRFGLMTRCHGLSVYPV